jgi:hypothetical protein
MLIGLIGVRGSGKDTCAEYLVKRGAKRIAFADALYSEVATAFGVQIAELQDRSKKEVPQASLALANCRDQNFVEVFRAFSGQDILSKKFLAAPRSPREILQVWGTQYRRRSAHGWDSYWLDKVRDLIKESPPETFAVIRTGLNESDWAVTAESNTVFVVTDVRFRNEAEFIKREGGKLIRINRRVRDQEEAALREKGDPTALHPSATELLDYPCPSILNEEGKPESLPEGLKRLLPELFKD